MLDLMTFGSIKELYYEMGFHDRENDKESRFIDYNEKRRAYFDSSKFEDFHLIKELEK